MNKKIAPLIVASVLLLVLLSGVVSYQSEEDSSSYYSETSYITLEGTGISLNGSGATVEGSKITIWAASTYVLSGTLDDGQIIVDTNYEGPVTIVLNGTSINCSTSAPIYVANADSVVIVLTAGTENFLRDGGTYVFENSLVDEPNAALFSNDDLIIRGEGSLVVEANFHNGIQSDDDLRILGGNITVTAQNHGLKGKDSISISDATITVTAGDDGMQSDNAWDVSKGSISIERSTIEITSVDDGIQAETYIWVDESTIKITSDTGTGKGIKAGNDISINDGNLIISSIDDAIHSHGTITVDGGNLTLTTQDDGMHAETSLQIDGGNINITQCYEGLESETITINAGSIHIISSDDGVNAVGDTASISINGGYLSIDVLGDGLDVNGLLSMSGGTVLVNGPVGNDNGALDYDSSFPMTGGFLVAAGSSGMALAPTAASSTQYSVIVYFTSTLSAGTLFHIQSSTGEEIVTFAPTKTYQSVVVSSPAFQLGSTYTVYYGGSSNGTVCDSLFSSGTYSAGTSFGSFTITSLVSQVGTGGGGGTGPQPPGPKP